MIYFSVLVLIATVMLKLSSIARPRYWQRAEEKEKRESEAKKKKAEDAGLPYSGSTDALGTGCGRIIINGPIVLAYLAVLVYWVLKPETQVVCAISLAWFLIGTFVATLAKDTKNFIIVYKTMHNCIGLIFDIWLLCLLFSMAKALA